MIGAYALAMHGYVRATGDMDLWIDPVPANAARVISALRRFGAPLKGLTQQDLETPGVVFQIGVAPLRIDILTSISGVTDFADALKNALCVSLEDMAIPVLSRDDLISNKSMTGRIKDLQDVLSLQRQRSDDPE